MKIHVIIIFEELVIYFSINLIQNFRNSFEMKGFIRFMIVSINTTQNCIKFMSCDFPLKSKKFYCC